MAQPSQSTEDLSARLDRLTQLAHLTASQCRSLLHIAGMQKVLKRCQAELKFLHGIKKKDTLEESHLQSTNLTHLQGILRAADCLPHVIQVLQPYSLPDQTTLTVDVICNHGYTWVKVIARKAQALHHVWAGDGQFGEKSIIDQAGQYIECAKQYPVTFNLPQILFIFTNGVTEPLQHALEEVGVSVHGVQVGCVDPPVNPAETLPPSSCHHDFAAADDCFPGNGGDAEEESDEGSNIPTASSLFDSLTLSANKSAVHACQADCATCSFGCCTCAGSETRQGPLTHSAGPQTGLELSGLPADQQCQSKAADSCETSRQKCDAPARVAYNKPSLCLTETPEGIRSSQQASRSSPPSTVVTPGGGHITKTLARLQEGLGLPQPHVFTVSSAELQLLFRQVPEVSRVNLDITTLISLVSNVCHGQCHFVFEEAILTEQARQERRSPLLPKLHAFIQGKELYTCETAVHDFRTILATVGGPQEQQRAKQLLAKVTVVPDDLSHRTCHLQLSLKVKQRARAIFGTGDSLHAVTITANSGFVRAASNQGVNYAVYLHESRALTEQKESTAKPWVDTAVLDTPACVLGKQTEN